MPIASTLAGALPRGGLLVACLLPAMGCWNPGQASTQVPSVPAPATAEASMATTPEPTVAETPPAPADIRDGLRPDLDYVDLRSAQYGRFREWVDRAAAGNPGYNFSAVDAAWMYLLTGRQRYCDLAVGTVEAQVAAAEAAIATGGFAPVAGNSYLEAGHAISALAATWDACRGSLAPAQAERWRRYADQTVWNIWNHRQARWGEHEHPWTGWATDNPGNNYYYSFLAATMSWGLASGNAGILADLREHRLPPLRAYFDRLPGGGSREGTGYGVSHMNLFPLYATWRDATGEDLANANTHLTDTIHYWIHATVPTFSHYAPIGDLARYANPEMFDYHRALVLHARHLTASDEARSAASWWLGNIPVARMREGFNLRTDLLPAGRDGRPPTALLHHARGVGHLFARSGWERDATWLSLVAGPYEESHAHQDQGAFNLFSRDWLAVTANTWTRSGINQDTRLHNMLRFERAEPQARQCQGLGDTVVQQCHGTASTLEITPGAAGSFTAIADLTPAYAGNPAVKSWRRHLDFSDRALTVRDEFALGPGTTAVFQLQVPVQPRIEGNVVHAGRLRMTVLEPAAARIEARAWPEIGGAGFRDGWRIDVSGGDGRYLVRLEPQ